MPTVKEITVLSNEYRRYVGYSDNIWPFIDTWMFFKIIVTKKLNILWAIENNMCKIKIHIKGRQKTTEHQ